VQLGPKSGGLCDVDLDCTEAVVLAPAFLPPTHAVFGRKSKPRSHYLYRIADPEPKATICRRLAAKASEKDKAVLLKIAEAWEAQAEAAGGKKKSQPDGGTGPSPK
jgi:hypothetical protein